MAAALSNRDLPPLSAAPLYSRALARLAGARPPRGRLERPQTRVEKSAPVCGSRVVVDLIADDEGRVAALGQEVRACALGQASAALMGAHAIGDRKSTSLDSS